MFWARRPASKTQALVQQDDGYRDRAAVEVPRRHDRVREIVAVLPLLEDDEAPRLHVLGASGGTPGLKDLREHVLGYGSIRVLAYLALCNDSQVSIHRAQVSPS